MSSLRTLRAVKSLPSLRQPRQTFQALRHEVPPVPSISQINGGPYSSIRHLHESAPSPTPSHVLKPSLANSFASQTVVSLRSECKKRGISSSGRKAELVDRLASFDTAGVSLKRKSPSKMHQSSSCFSTTTKPMASTSTTSTPSVGAFKIPRETEAQKEEQRQQSMSIKIPVLPHVEKKAQTVETHYDTVPPHGGKAAGAPEGHAGTEESIPVRSMGYHDVSSMENAYRVVQGEASTRDKPYQSTEEPDGESTLQDKDKLFLGGFAAAVAGWWLLGSMGKKNKKDKKGH